MATTGTDPNRLKQMMKEALIEVLHEQRELFHEVFADVLEDFMLGEAIRNGRQTKNVSRDEVFAVLLRKS